MLDIACRVLLFLAVRPVEIARTLLETDTSVSNVQRPKSLSGVRGSKSGYKKDQMSISCLM